MAASAAPASSTSSICEGRGSLGGGAAGSGRGSHGLAGAPSTAAPSVSWPRRCRREVHRRERRVLRSEARLAPLVAEDEESRLEDEALSSLTICRRDRAAPRLDDSSAPPRSSPSPGTRPPPSGSTEAAPSPDTAPPHTGEGRGASAAVASWRRCRVKVVGLYTHKHTHIQQLTFSNLLYIQESLKMLSQSLPYSILITQHPSILCLHFSSFPDVSFHICSHTSYASLFFIYCRAYFLTSSFI